MTDDRMSRIAHESEGRARIIRETASVCAKCGLSMMRVPGRTVHYSCDPDYPLAGQRCTCPPGCSMTRWGDGIESCDPGCAPCKTMRGQMLSKRGAS